MPSLGQRRRYPARLANMPNRSQWSISRLFLWVFVAALVASHLSTFYQRQIVGFTDFSLEVSEVKQWITELDSSAESHGGGAGSSRSGNSVDSDFNYLFTSKNATSEQILSHLKSKINKQLQNENWTIRGWGGGSDSFNFHAYNGHTSFRIYGWIVPNIENSYASQLEEQGKNATRIKILRVGYLTR